MNSRRQIIIPPDSFFSDHSIRTVIRALDRKDEEALAMLEYMPFDGTTGSTVRGDRFDYDIRDRRDNRRPDQTRSLRCRGNTRTRSFGRSFVNGLRAAV